MEEFLKHFTQANAAYINVYIAILRWLAPALALLLILRCIKPLMTFRREPEIWAWLCPEGGKKLPVTHWENVIGRHRRSDLVIDFPTVSRNHAVLTRYDDGTWTICDTGSASGVLLNGEQIAFMDLMRYLLIGSGNDAANAAAVRCAGSLEAFAEKMSQAEIVITHGGTGAIIGAVIGIKRKYR